MCKIDVKNNKIANSLQIICNIGVYVNDRIKKYAIFLDKTREEVYHHSNGKAPRFAAHFIREAKDADT